MKRSIVGLTVILLLLACTFAATGEYKVKKGDSLSKIGKQSGVPWQKIAEINKVASPYAIKTGQRLKIPRNEAVKSVVVPVSSTQYLNKIVTLQTEIAELEKKSQVAAEVPVKKEEVALAAATEKKEVVQTKDEKQGTEAKQETVVASKDETPITPTVVYAEQIKESYVANDQFDAYMSVGGWTSTGNKDASTGVYGQTKVRYRPYTLNLFDYEVGVGGFVLGETGSGSTGQWDFRWNKFAVGPSFKVYGDNWDATTDLGYAKQWDFGASDKQITDSIYLLEYVNFEQRRGAGYKLFPQTELMFVATIPFSSSKESTKSGKTFGNSLPTDDKSVYNLEVKQSIYDFNFDNHLRLTPGISLGGGLEASDGYGKVGAFVKLGAYGQDILIADLSVKDKSNVDGLRYYGSLMLNVGGAIKAIKASRISQAKAEDLVYKPVK